MTEAEILERNALVAERDGLEAQISDVAAMEVLPLEERLTLIRKTVGLSKRIYLIDQQARSEQ